MCIWTFPCTSHLITRVTHPCHFPPSNHFHSSPHLLYLSKLCPPPLYRPFPDTLILTIREFCPLSIKLSLKLLCSEIAQLSCNITTLKLQFSILNCKYSFTLQHKLPSLPTKSTPHVKDAYIERCSGFHQLQFWFPSPLYLTQPCTLVSHILHLLLFSFFA